MSYIYFCYRLYISILERFAGNRVYVHNKVYNIIPGYIRLTHKQFVVAFSNGNLTKYCRKSRMNSQRYEWRKKKFSKPKNEHGIYRYIISFILLFGYTYAYKFICTFRRGEWPQYLIWALILSLSLSYFFANYRNPIFDCRSNEASFIKQFRYLS